MQATLECDLTVPSRILPYSRFFSRIITQASIVCASFTHFFSIYPSDPFLPARKTPPLCLSTVRVNKWVRGFHYASSVFKAYTLVGWHFWSLLCKMWRQRQPFAASTSTHEVWPALQYTPSPISFLLFPISDVRLYTDNHTQCRLWALEVFWTDSPCNSRIFQIQFSVNSLNSTCHTICTVTHSIELLKCYVINQWIICVFCASNKNLSFSPAFHYGTVMTSRGFQEKCVFLISAVCTDTVLWSIMQVWHYIMLLVIATLQISLYCFYLMLFFLTSASFCFFHLFF